MVLIDDRSVTAVVIGLCADDDGRWSVMRVMYGQGRPVPIFASDPMSRDEADATGMGLALGLLAQGFRLSNSVEVEARLGAHPFLAIEPLSERAHDELSARHSEVQLAELEARRSQATAKRAEAEAVREFQEARRERIAARRAASAARDTPPSPRKRSVPARSALPGAVCAQGTEQPEVTPVLPPLGTDSEAERLVPDKDSAEEDTYLAGIILRARSLEI